MRRLLLDLLSVILSAILVAIFAMGSLASMSVEVVAQPDFPDITMIGQTQTWENDYYEDVCRVLYLGLGGDPYKWLHGLRWTRPYEKDAWDCSRQSAYLEWLLEGCDVEAEIVMLPGHTMLRVLLNDEWRFYDPSLGAFMPDRLLEPTDWSTHRTLASAIEWYLVHFYGTSAEEHAFGVWRYGDPAEVLMREFAWWRAE